MDKFPYEDHILSMQEGDEDVIFIKGKPFIVAPATEADVERIGKGFFVMD
jgi:hypothetical protein